MCAEKACCMVVWRCYCSLISRSVVAPMLILVETRKPRTWLFRYQPIRSHTNECISPAILYPSHVSPCNQGAYVHCISTLYRYLKFILLLRTNSSTFALPRSHQPVVSSLRRSSQSLSATTSSPSVPWPPIGKPPTKLSKCIYSSEGTYYSMRTSVHLNVP